VSFLFEDHALDPNRRELRRGGTMVPVEPRKAGTTEHPQLISGVSWVGAFARGRGFLPPLARLLLRLLELLGADLGRHTVAVPGGGDAPAGVVEPRRREVEVEMRLDEILLHAEATGRRSTISASPMPVANRSHAR
jgi:hypothetical protein